MHNLYREFLDLLPARPRVVGDVTAEVSPGVYTITLPGGAVLNALGESAVGQRVFVRDGVIEGSAPTLTYIEGEA
jgi:hypothetical protein